MYFHEKWACNEANPALRDVFGKMQDLQLAHQEMFRMHASFRLNYRDFYKELLTEERQLDVVQKHADQCARHCVKLEKQLEGLLRKKTDRAKLEAVQAELKAAHGK